MNQKVPPTIFNDFGVPLFLIGTDVPESLRSLAPDGLNWICLNTKGHDDNLQTAEGNARSGHIPEQEKNGVTPNKVSRIKRAKAF